MVLRRLFRGGGDVRLEPGQPAAPVPSSETESIRRISGQLEALPLEGRRFVAGYAYVLARVAHADLEVSADELDFIEKALIEVGHLSEPQAVLVVDMARHMTEIYGATDDYVVTREFANGATRQQREDLLRTAFAVGAVDDSITASESAELNQVGKELGFRADEIDAIRVGFSDQLAALQAMRRMRR